MNPNRAAQLISEALCDAGFHGADGIAVLTIAMTLSAEGHGVDVDWATVMKVYETLYAQLRNERNLDAMPVAGNA